MISYYTQVNVQHNFNRELLLEMFFSWLENSKNKIDHLEYHHENSFVYKEERKTLKIEDFNEYGVFGIQFTTSDNYKKAQFVVEIMFDESNHRLDLGFYKELNEDSRYISAISLPKIFVQLLQSDYILSDHQLKIQDQPIFLSYREYKQLMKHHFQLPLVVLIRNQKCIVNPFRLAEKLFGLAHVICVRCHDELSMKINYPNKDIEIIDSQNENKMIKQCYDAVLNYSIQEYTQSYMFDELVKARLHQEKASSEELENFYQESVLETQKEVNEYKELYQQTLDEYQTLCKKKEELEEYLKSMNNEVILSMNTNDSYKQELILEIIQKTLKNLDATKVYRKREVLTSILKENTK